MAEPKLSEPISDVQNDFKNRLIAELQSAGTPIDEDRLLAAVRAHDAPRVTAVAVEKAAKDLGG